MWGAWEEGDVHKHNLPRHDDEVVHKVHAVNNVKDGDLVRGLFHVSAANVGVKEAKDEEGDLSPEEELSNGPDPNDDPPEVVLGAGE